MEHTADGSWLEISRTSVWRRFGRAIEAVEYRMPDGNTETFYLAAVRPAVSVFALTPDREVILVEQYRPGPARVLRELPGGFVDPREEAAGAAARELQEETGYAGTLTPLTTCYDDAYSTMVRHCYAATDCLQVAAPTPDSTEHVKTVLVPLEEFRAQLRSGASTDVEVGYLALDYLGLL
ncbi:NUDIX hydrolase [Streptosporangium sp. NPDC051023]|uniref:NUDIX hydrolase n=1 Tax=Streptosporangium sp. NPDC051023 TaxID=3155410 RepID=UPI00344C8A93